MANKHLNIVIDDETDKTLRDIRHVRGVTFTATVRKAVALYRMVLEAQDAGGGMQIVNDKGAVVRSPRIL